MSEISYCEQNFCFDREDFFSMEVDETLMSIIDECWNSIIATQEKLIELTQLLLAINVI